MGRTRVAGPRIRLALGAVLGASCAALPARALDARFSPAHPQQGDTIAIRIRVAPDAQAPTVAIGTRRFTAFRVSDGLYRALVPSSPLDKPGRWTARVTSGAGETTLAISLAARRFGVQRIRLPPGVSRDLDPIERERVAAAKALASPEKLWSGPFRLPAAGRVSTAYGVRRWVNGVFLGDYYHRGIDLAAAAGAPVKAPAAGRVVLAGHEHEGFPVHGNVIALDHGQGVVSFYLHLSRIVVAEGAVVAAGDTIGLVGGTGAATAPHLHWGLYVDGVCVDPAPWLAPGIE